MEVSKQLIETEHVDMAHLKTTVTIQDAREVQSIIELVTRWRDKHLKVDLEGDDAYPNYNARLKKKTRTKTAQNGLIRSVIRAERCWARAMSPLIARKRSKQTVLKSMRQVDALCQILSEYENEGLHVVELYTLGLIYTVLFQDRGEDLVGEYMELSKAARAISLLKELQTKYKEGLLPCTAVLNNMLEQIETRTKFVRVSLLALTSSGSQLEALQKAISESERECNEFFLKMEANYPPPTSSYESRPNSNTNDLAQAKTKQIDDQQRLENASRRLLRAIDLFDCVPVPPLPKPPQATKDCITILKQWNSQLVPIQLLDLTKQGKMTFLRNVAAFGLLSWGFSSAVGSALYLSLSSPATQSDPIFPEDSLLQQIKMKLETLFTETMIRTLSLNSVSTDLTPLIPPPPPVFFDIASNYLTIPTRREISAPHPETGLPMDQTIAKGEKSPASPNQQQRRGWFKIPFIGGHH